MSKIDVLLNQLDRLKQTGPGKWLACCPAHEDRSPSLAVKETDDGRVLLYCFGGCSVDSIVSAVGLELSDLFPEMTGRGWDASIPRPNPPQYRAAELLATAAHESRIVAMAVMDIAGGKPLNEADSSRVVMAANALAGLLSEIER